MEYDTHSFAPVAYLSARSTAEIKVRHLIYKSIPLASAFQLAEFRYIGGTLWAADDDTAVKITEKFNGGLELDVGQLIEQNEVSRRLMHSINQYCIRGVFLGMVWLLRSGHHLYT